METASRSPCSSTTSTLRVSGARASVSTGRVMREGYRKWEGQPGGWPWGASRRTYFLAVADAGPVEGLAGAISACGVRTLGGEVALAAGECAPEASSGF